MQASRCETGLCLWSGRPGRPRALHKDKSSEAGGGERGCWAGGGLRTLRLAAPDPSGGKNKQRGLSPGPNRLGLQQTDGSHGPGCSGTCARGRGFSKPSHQSPRLGAILLSSSKVGRDWDVLYLAQFRTGLGPPPPAATADGFDTVQFSRNTPHVQ